MKALLLIFLLIIVFVDGQTVSPCVTNCVIGNCPYGLTDTVCICQTENAPIVKCISGCTAGAIAQWQVYSQQYCKIFMLRMCIDCLGGTSVSSVIAASSESATSVSSSSTTSGTFSTWKANLIGTSTPSPSVQASTSSVTKLTPFSILFLSFCLGAVLYI